MTWIQTYQGRRFDLLAATVDDVDIVDIAHALARRLVRSADLLAAIDERRMLMPESHALFPSGRRPDWDPGLTPRAREYVETARRLLVAPRRMSAILAKEAFLQRFHRLSTEVRETGGPVIS